MSVRSECRNYLKTVNMELTTIARACGKQDVHHLEREDLVALTVEAAAMASIPLAGTIVGAWQGMSLRQPFISIGSSIAVQVRPWPGVECCHSRRAPGIHHVIPTVVQTTV